MTAVAAVAKVLNLIGALYIGHSMGGFTGMFCEVRHPGTFSAMCLLATAAAGGGGHAGPDAGKFLIEHGNDREILQKAVAPMYLHGDNGAANVEAILLMDRRVHEIYFAEYPKRVIIDEIRHVDIPVLVLNGARDSVVPLSTQHETALALPNCKEVILTTEGHMLPRESGDLTAREIIAFWKHDVGKTLPWTPRERAAPLAPYS
jgi:pimeloyl-ACP methyl ester carboxylesterase